MAADKRKKKRRKRKKGKKSGSAANAPLEANAIDASGDTGSDPDSDEASSRSADSADAEERDTVGGDEVPGTDAGREPDNRDSGDDDSGDDDSGADDSGGDDSGTDDDSGADDDSGDDSDAGSDDSDEADSGDQDSDAADSGEDEEEPDMALADVAAALEEVFSSSDLQAVGSEAASDLADEDESAESTTDVDSEPSEADTIPDDDDAQDTAGDSEVADPAGTDDGRDESADTDAEADDAQDESVDDETRDEPAELPTADIQLPADESDEAIETTEFDLTDVEDDEDVEEIDETPLLTPLDIPSTSSWSLTSSKPDAVPPSEDEIAALETLDGEGDVSDEDHDIESMEDIDEMLDLEVIELEPLSMATSAKLDAEEMATKTVEVTLGELDGLRQIATKFGELESLLGEALRQRDHLVATNEELETIATELQTTVLKLRQQEQEAKTRVAEEIDAERSRLESARQEEKTQLQNALDEAREAHKTERLQLNEQLEKARQELERLPSLEEDLAKAQRAAAQGKKAEVVLERLQDNLRETRAEAARVPDLLTEVEALRAELSKADKALADATNDPRVEELSAELDKVRNDRDDARQQLHKLQGELEGVQAKLDAQQESGAELDDEIKTVRQRLTDKESELKDALKDLRTVQGELEELLSTSQSTESEIEELRATLQERDAQVEDLEGQLEGLKEEAEAELEATRSSLTEQIETLNEALADAGGDRVDVGALEEQLEEAEDRLDAARVELELARARAERAMEQSRDAETALKESEAARAEALALAEQLQDELQSTLGELDKIQGDSAQVDQLRRERDGAVNRADSRQAELESLRAEIAELRAGGGRAGSGVAADTHRELLERIAKLEDERASFEMALEQAAVLKAEHQDLAKAFEDLQKSHFERGSQLMQALTESERLRANLSGIAKELQSLRRQADQAEGAKARVRAEIEREIRAGLEEKVAAQIEAAVKARTKELSGELQKMRSSGESNPSGELRKFPDSRSLREQMRAEGVRADSSPKIGTLHEPMALSPDVPSGIENEINAMFGGPPSDRDSRIRRGPRGTQIGQPQAKPLSSPGNPAAPKASIQRKAGSKRRKSLADPVAILRKRGLLRKRPSVDFSRTDGVDHRAGFLLTQIDGVITIQDLIDLSGLDAEEAARLIIQLIDLGAVRF